MWAQASSGALTPLAEHGLARRIVQAGYGLAFYPAASFLPPAFAPLLPLYERPGAFPGAGPRIPAARPGERRRAGRPFSCCAAAPGRRHRGRRLPAAGAAGARHRPVGHPAGRRPPPYLATIPLVLLRRRSRRAWAATERPAMRAGLAALLLAAARHGRRDGPPPGAQSGTTTSPVAPGARPFRIGPGEQQPRHVARRSRRSGRRPAPPRPAASRSPHATAGPERPGRPARSPLARRRAAGAPGRGNPRKRPRLAARPARRPLRHRHWPSSAAATKKRPNASSAALLRIDPNHDGARLALARMAAKR